MLDPGSIAGRGLNINGLARTRTSTYDDLVGQSNGSRRVSRPRARTSYFAITITPLATNKSKCQLTLRIQPGWRPCSYLPHDTSLL